MTSEPTEAYVWVWLPGTTEPVVAGLLEQRGATITFTYGRSYLARRNAIALYEPELPLTSDVLVPRVGTLAGCIADAGPDAWGQRVILHRHFSQGRVTTHDPGTLTYLLESGSNRIGALDFQTSPTEYVPRWSEPAGLAELVEAAERIEEGVPLTDELAVALLHGSSVGGARPKALLRDGDRQLIAKFSSTTDTYPVVKAEFLAMELARRAGLDVAGVQLVSVHGKDVLLVERFDRPAPGERRAMVSALTILGLTENEAIFGASYVELAHCIRRRFTRADATLRELFARIAFSILVGNSDDHPRNHAAFWDGAMLTLTPAYDICPGPRSGNETRQLMEFAPGERLSQVVRLVGAAAYYHLSTAEAREIIDHQNEMIRAHWTEVCDAAGLTEIERRRFRGRQFLNEYALEGYA